MSMVSLHDCLRNARCRFPSVDSILVTEETTNNTDTIGEFASTLDIANRCEWYLEFDRFVFAGGNEKDTIFRIAPSYLRNLSGDDLLDFYTAVITQWGFWVYRELYEQIKSSLTPEMNAELRIRLQFDKA